MKKTLSLVAIVIFLSTIISSCGKKESGPGNKYGLSTKNNVVWCISADITNVIPYLSHDANAQYVDPLIWEPLNTADYRTQKLLPWLASLPEISADHLTYTYTLNPKAKFSDGKPFTGDDVMFSYKCVMNPKQIETTQTRSTLNSVDSIGFVNGDKMKVAFYLSKPYFQMDLVLGGGYVLILPKHVFDPKNLTDKMSWKEIKSTNPSNPIFIQQATEFNDPSIARDPKVMIGTGPYLYEEWKTNDHISFKKDTNYWAKDLPWGEAYPNEIVFKTISDNNAQITALKGKDIDLLDNTPSSGYAQLDSTKQPYIKKDTAYYNSRTFVEWNAERPIFKSKKVRWAMSYLINREQIIKEVMKGLARSNNGPLNFTQPHYDATLPPLEFNPDKAKTLLAEDGWQSGDDGILYKVIDGKKTPFKFTISTYTGSEQQKQMALVISEQMRKVGIQVEVSSVEWTVWINTTREHDYDAAIATLLGNASEDDPYEIWHSSQAKGKGQNVWSFINPEADKILEENRTEFDFNKRDSLMKRFQRIVYDEMPITPICSQPVKIARLDRFDNVEFFTQRPCFNVPFWVIRGSGIQAKPGSPSTVKPIQQ